MADSALKQRLFPQTRTATHSEFAFAFIGMAQ